MARGIDTAAHEGALASGTCAVVAGGIDIVYPPENAALYERIKAEGASFPRWPLGQPPQARHFPRRNRIISGLARGVVVEAAEGSGSLITANYALEQNREIFAVPGSPLDPRAKGTNRLIREGAVLTETADDVLSRVCGRFSGHGFANRNQATELPLAGSRTKPKPTASRDGRGSARPRAGRHRRIDSLCGAPAGAVLTMLLELELAGTARHPGNKVSWA